MKLFQGILNRSINASESTLTENVTLAQPRASSSGFRFLTAVCFGSTTTGFDETALSGTGLTKIL
jgi:hypothetical protein